MVDKRGSLRNKPPISYEISDDSDIGGSTSATSSPFATPQKPHRSRTIIDLEVEDIEEVVSPTTPPPRLSSAGHSLRQHSHLHLSLKAQENGDKPSLKRKFTQPGKNSDKKMKLKQTSDDPAPILTARKEIRDSIATQTRVKRANFFVAKKDYFLPLLPASNHISKLLEQHQLTHGKADISTTAPYEVLRSQPKGVKATMKPYQLSGLSFLVYLYRNGLSGILGDEMGLGKTLQTLALIQYLKENRKAFLAHDEIRPCLVVCPLSVLSSWMAEARRWTPSLKVLRFHGVAHERNRLKKVALGEEDMCGNQTLRAKKKKNQQLTAHGKPIIDLDSEDELTEEPGVDLIVTTYEGFQAEQAWFKKAFVWQYVILDEGHKIKNSLSQISASLQGLGAEYRLILTGTPLQNNLVELWALLHWLYPEVFTGVTADLFKRSFDLTRGKISTAVMDDARRLLELIMLRRMKTSPGVDLNLPPKTDVLLFVPLSPMQRFWYTRLLTKTDKGLLEELFQGAKEKEVEAIKEEGGAKREWEDQIEELETLESQSKNASHKWEESKEIMRKALEAEQRDESKKSAWRKLMNLLMQLRKCCNHPYLLPHAEPEPYYLGEHLIHASGKFMVLDKIIRELVVKQRKKVLIFSGFTRMLDCCEDLLSLRGGDGENFEYVRLDGGTGRARRNLGIRMFNSEQSNYRVMLISTRAGGLGINLATASDVIMLDQDWNPQIMLQAEARAHRIGQTKPVTIYKLCTQGTVEEQMIGRIQKKLYLSAKVTEAMRDIHTPTSAKSKKKGHPTTDDDMPQLNTSQLMSLVRRGAQALSHTEIDIDDMLGWDWPTMLEKCKDKPADIHVSEQTQADTIVKEEDEKQWLSQMEQVESRVFEGKKWDQERGIGKNDHIRQEWSREERRKGKNMTVMVDGYAVSKESMRCADWEAVPTFAGKDPRLMEVRRQKKPPISNQEHCQVCWDGGDLVLCSGCPRSYHMKCLGKDFKARARSHMSFHCPQHQCVTCEQKTTDAGGMIYRCRWCERGYCEDCLDWDKTELAGENLIEYELLGFPAITQAFYIHCQNCKDHHVESPKALAFCQNMIAEYKAKHKEMRELRSFAGTNTIDGIKKAESPPSRDESLTDAPTVESSGINTPNVKNSEICGFSRGSKRHTTSAELKPRH